MNYSAQLSIRLAQTCINLDNLYNYTIKTLNIREITKLKHLGLEKYSSTYKYMDGGVEFDE